ncbi:MAG: hypothetical protein IT442_17620 [Phycisphaeraceae bacterium]|nr:hypothetical protein [Phycisphaeraceae bacterium]
MPPATLAHRLRFLLLALGLLGTLAGLAWIGLVDYHQRAGLLGTPLPIFFAQGLRHYYTGLSIFLGLFFLTQYLFLRPPLRRHRRQPWIQQLAEPARPMLLSAIIAGLMAMLLSTALLATLLELPDLWADFVFQTSYGNWAVWSAMALAWILWSLVFAFYRPDADRYTQYSRVLNALLAGSLLESLIAAPVQALTYHRDDCYCVRGSYTGLVFGLTVLFWAFGPAIFLLFLREKVRLARAAPLCPQCAYDLRGSIAAGSTTCPECGAPIPRQAILMAKRLEKGDTTHYL